MAKKSKERAVPVADGESAIKPQGPQEPAPISYWKLYSLADRLDWLLILIGSLGGAANGAAWPVFALFVGDFTDAFGNPNADIRQVASNLAIKFVVVGGVALVASYAEASMWMWAGYRQAHRLRRNFLAATLQQDVGFFDIHTTSGALQDALNADTLAVQAGISEKVGAFVHFMCQFVAGFAMAFWRGWDLALVLLGCVPFIAVCGYVQMRQNDRLERQAGAAYATASAVAQQAIGQIRTVAAYGQQERVLGEYKSHLDLPVKVGIQQGLLAGISLGAFNGIFYCSVAAAYYYGAWRVVNANYSGGAILNVLVAILMGGLGLGQGLPLLQYFTAARIAGARLYKVIDRNPEVADREGATSPETVSGDIELRDVRFAYPSRPDVHVLKSLTLHASAGRTTALVGSSGSGKSSIIALVLRFYDPQGGAILLDGRDVRDVKLTWLRSQMGLVSQEPTLFATSIYDNIAMGREGASRQEVEAAARAANAHGFISALPQGYETHAGERGLQLSGGQKQRVAIARAVLRNPRILLLDEATSALDTASERLVQAALNEAAVGRTTIVVAHRLSTIRDACTIAVISQGNIMQLGDHDKLMEDDKGIYAGMVKLQSAQYAVEVEVEAAEKKEAVELGLETLGEDEVIVQEEGGHKKGVVEVEMAKEVEKRAEAGAEGVVPAEKKGGKKCKRGKEEEKNGVTPVSVPFKRLLEMNRPERSFLLSGLLGSVGAGAITPAFAYVLGSVVISMYQPPDKILSDASFYCWMLFVVAVWGLLTRGLQGWSFGVAGHKLGQRVRVALFGSILHQETAWFEDPARPSASLASLLSTDAAAVRGAVGDLMGMVVTSVSCLIFGYTIGLVHDWRMTLVVTAELPFMLVATSAYFKYIGGNDQNIAALYAGLNAGVSDAFLAIRVVHAYGLKTRMEDLYALQLSGIDRMMFKKCQVAGALMGFAFGTIFGMYGLVIWFGGIEIYNGWSNFNDLLIAFMSILLGLEGISQAQMAFPDLGRAQGALQRIFPIIDRKPLIDAADPGGEKLKEVLGELSYEQVTFAYPARPSVIVFHSVTVSVPAGATLALVGESGSGKSTAVALAVRFYDPLKGAVALDGVDLRHLNLQWLRSQFALVNQEPLLFATSILENIRYGRPQASLAEVEAAAAAANAADFIASLPDGLNTHVGEQGVQLSGGQKQRVAIARAVLKSPRVLLLDEATSALDSASEAVVQAALEQLMKGRTAVVVAHRLSTIRNADTIAYVYRGHIVEKGSHEQLVANPEGWYARLVSAQLGYQSTLLKRGEGSQKLGTQHSELEAPES